MLVHITVLPAETAIVCKSKVLSRIYTSFGPGVSFEQEIRLRATASSSTAKGNGFVFIAL